MDARILSASGAERHRPPAHPEGRRVTSLPRGPLHGPKGHESPVMSCKLFRFTLLSKNASANHLESHSCKNKGLKVPCFHTLTKKGVGEGVLSNLQPHISNLRSSLTPLDSALTSKRAPKSFTCNTYEKHTQGEGVTSSHACLSASRSPGCQPPSLSLPVLHSTAPGGDSMKRLLQAAIYGVVAPLFLAAAPLCAQQTPFPSSLVP